MKNFTKAILILFLSTIINLAISLVFFQLRGSMEFMGYMAGTLLSFIFSLLWILGARKGMKSNTLVLLMITFGGFPLRLGIFGVFAFSGLYLFKMDKTLFAAAFLVGTILSLIVEVWFFNSIRMPGDKKIR
jgi:hypothetical protein